MAAKDELGRRGEDVAVRYLEQRGLVVLSRNWRCRDGELDVVARDADRLVVCEVKTRSGTRFGEPAEAVTREGGPDPAGRRRRGWPRTTSRWCEIRFDVVAVLLEPRPARDVQHFEAAF